VRQVGQVGSVNIYENPRALPLAWLVGQTTLVDSDDAALAAMAADDFDPRRTAVITAGDDSNAPSLSASATDSAEITRYLQSVVDVTTRTSGPGLLVTSQPEYPGWIATVDGQSAPHVNVDYAFVGVVVPPGEHHVQLSYEPLSVRAGAALSIVTLLVCVAAVFWRRIR
jgi:hypothetical protein